MTDLLRKECNVKVPVNIGDLIAQLGGSIKYEYFEGEPSNLRKINSKNFLIIINSKKVYKDTNFEIAKEIGRLIFDGGYLIDRDRWESIENNSTIRSQIDTEIINDFAASLLMPLNEFKSDLRDSCRDTHSPDLSRLASLYDVSYDLIVSRGIRLGLLSF